MQVFKKIYFGILCLCVASCSSVEIKDEGGADSSTTDISEIGISTSKSFRVGMLLPLSGNDVKYGEGLRNASMIALSDINNPNLVLQYYDTKSSQAGARIAIENAINQGADLIIGPLKSTETQAISSETIYQGIPVIAFSTAQEVLQPTVYTLGLLVDERVDRIVSYAAQKGRKRLALLLPDNQNGAAIAKAAVKSAQKNNILLTKIGFYDPQTSDFSNIAKEMTNYDNRHAMVNKIKANLKYKADNGDINAQKSLKTLETREGLGDVGFDSLLVAEAGAKLTAAISMFAYYDAAYPQVQFLGTPLWEASRLNNESAISKSVYPTLSKPKSNDFANKYYNMFNEKAGSLYALAYDAVGIANSLSMSSNENINDNIISLNGFDGTNGKVRFFKDGTNQHTLDVVEILPSGNIIVDSGEIYFESPMNSLDDVIITGEYKAPKIFGKDKTLAQVLIYGEVLAPENEATDDYAAENSEIVRQQLKTMGIFLN